MVDLQGYIDKLVEEANKGVNIPFMSEEQEKALLEKVFSFILMSLPAPLLKLILDAGDGISEEEIKYWVEWLSNNQVTQWIDYWQTRVKLLNFFPDEVLKLYFKQGLEMVLKYAAKGLSLTELKKV